MGVVGQQEMVEDPTGKITWETNRHVGGEVTTMQRRHITAEEEEDEEQEEQEEQGQTPISRI